MDPIQFQIDWDLLAQVLITIIVLAFLVERALSIVTENKWFVESRMDESGLKEILSIAVSFLVVYIVSFDALAIIFKLEAPRFPGMLITAAVIAGGSKASIKLFQDVMNIKSSARRQKDEQKAIERSAELQATRAKVG